MKTNCWEFKNCGREPNGSNVDEHGICPASTEKAIDGVHDGKNAGRACWVVAGSMCNRKMQGTFAQKYKDCILCDFYQAVVNEEDKNLEISIVLLKKLYGSKSK